MKEYFKKILDTRYYIEDSIHLKPTIGLVLGSGLGVLADRIEDPITIDYRDIPNFPVSTVEGHDGQLVIGRLMDKQIMVLKGRFHYYEGYTMNDITFPIRVMANMGVGRVVFTNAAGGINKSFVPGDLMIINDHINFGFDNPLIGYNNPRTEFSGISNIYSKDLVTVAKKVAKENNMDIRDGTYAFLTGPAYETPAEIEMMTVLGVDAVGMSTVPEAIAAVHEGLEVLGISCITNMAAGILDKPLNHDEVITTARSVEKKFIVYIKGIIKNI